MIYVDTIESGTVIDHIPAGRGMKVLTILGITEEFPHRVALVINAPSKKGGKKDIVKIEATTISDTDLNKIALLAPNATVNIIAGSKVSSKKTVALPKQLKGAGKCPNPHCIVNHEPASQTRFFYDEKKYRCNFCERLFEPGELL